MSDIKKKSIELNYLTHSSYAHDYGFHHTFHDKRKWLVKSVEKIDCGSTIYKFYPQTFDVDNDFRFLVGYLKTEFKYDGKIRRALARYTRDEKYNTLCLTLTEFKPAKTSKCCGDD